MPISGLAEREKFSEKLHALAARQVYLGTSSWKYQGWCGSVYDEQRYIWRGRFAQSRFHFACLAEYAKTFQTVCVDAAYYKFPDRDYLDEMVSQVPPDFLFALKVTDEITIKKFTNLPRFGARAGKPNENFLNADLFATAFVEPCKEFQQNIGLLIFEFSRFYPADFQRGRDFIEALDTFLAALPKGWPYGVEIRNKYFLKPAYFETLAKHHVTHVYNSWGDMPPVSEQAVIEHSVSNPELVAARFLLKPGRKYEQAVKLFSPYNELKEISPEERKAGAQLVREGLSAPKRRTLIYVNNRLEGHAPTTIRAMIDQSEALNTAD